TSAPGAAHGGVGRCKCAFWFAVAHDVLGFIILLSGVFANVFFHDFLMYVGAVVIFLSLIWWIFWYTGNIEAAPQELDDDVGFYRRNKGLSGVVRKVTNGIRSSLRRGGGSAQGPGVLAMGARSAISMRLTPSFLKRNPGALAAADPKHPGGRGQRDSLSPIPRTSHPPSASYPQRGYAGLLTSAPSGHRTR
uniref:Uncharacterized protein n=1 Tax=Denticeps clupeoides TaxID=299321 RepID=A0AAY4C7N6_9TELE